MLFCKAQCDFSTWKDLVCLVEHVLIAYRPLGSFSSFVFLLYFAELSTTKSRLNLLVVSQDFWSLGLDFKWEPMCLAWGNKIKCWKANCVSGREAWQRQEAWQYQNIFSLSYWTFYMCMVGCCFGDCMMICIVQCSVFCRTLWISLKQNWCLHLILSFCASHILQKLFYIWLDFLLTGFLLT